MNTPTIDRYLTKQKTNLIMLKSFAVILASLAVAAVSAANAEDKGAASAPTDAQIAMIVVVADTVDVDYGNPKTAAP